MVTGFFIFWFDNICWVTIQFKMKVNVLTLLSKNWLGSCQNVWESFTLCLASTFDVESTFLNSMSNCLKYSISLLKYFETFYKVSRKQ